MHEKAPKGTSGSMETSPPMAFDLAGFPRYTNRMARRVSSESGTRRYRIVKNDKTKETKVEERNDQLMVLQDM